MLTTTTTTTLMALLARGAFSLRLPLPLFGCRGRGIHDLAAARESEDRVRGRRRRRKKCVCVCVPFGRPFSSNACFFFLQKTVREEGTNCNRLKEIYKHHEWEKGERQGGENLAKNRRETRRRNASFSSPSPSFLLLSKRRREPTSSPSSSTGIPTHTG